MASTERTASATSSSLLLLLSYVGFVSLGLPDTVLGAAWPAIRDELGLPLDAAGAAVLLTTCGIVLSSAASGWLRMRIGAGLVLSGSTLLAALALLASGFAQRWALLLAAAALGGLGGGAIDATLNDHVARHHSARHMNWLHAFWGVGAAIAPSVVAFVLARGHSWRLAYFALGAVEISLALAFVATRSSWREDAVAADSGSAATTAGAPSRAAARASVAMFLCYGGLEAGTGLWISSLLTETRGLSHATAGAAVGFYWGALCAGRFVIGAWADRLGPARVLSMSVRAALAAVIVYAIPGTPTWLAVLALGALGFALAPIYPLAMHDTPRRFGPEGARLVGRQVSACAVGLASLPWLIGALAERIGLQWLPSTLVVLALGVIALERARRS